MAIAWIDFNNGDTGLNIRNALNTFNAVVQTNVNNLLVNVQTLFNTTATHTTAISSNLDNIAINAVDIGLLEVDVASAQGDILDLESPIWTDYTPQAVKPTDMEGRLFFSDECKDMCVFTDIPDTSVSLAQMTVLRVTNSTGSTIVKGQVCTYAGATGGYPLIRLAIADSFQNSIVLGVALHDIPNATEGFIVTQGKIRDMNTLGLTPGLPLYLSDTIPGALTHIPGNIISQVGGVTLADDIIGKFVVNSRSNIQLPSVFGQLHGAPVNSYVLNLTPINISAYTTEHSIVLPVNKLTGVITAKGTGLFRINFIGVGDFAALASTREFYVEAYNITQAVTIGTPITYSIPRDATTDSFTFNAPIDLIDGDEVVIRISATPDMTISFTDMSFDIESISVR